MRHHGLVAISLLGAIAWCCSPKQPVTRTAPPPAAPVAVAVPSSPSRAQSATPPPPAPTGPATVLFARTQAGLAPVACSVGHSFEHGPACLAHLDAGSPLALFVATDPWTVQEVPLPPLGDVRCLGAPPTRGLLWAEDQKGIEPAFAVWPASKASALHKLRPQVFYGRDTILDWAGRTLGVPSAEVNLFGTGTVDLDGTGEIRTLASVDVESAGALQLGAVVELRNQRAQVRYRQPHERLRLVWRTDLDDNGANELIVAGLRVQGVDIPVARSVALVRWDHDQLQPIGSLSCLTSLGVKRHVKL